MTDLETMLMSQEGTGVYRIVNTVNWRTYIGSSLDIKSRLCDHRSALARGAHRNRFLQRAWIKYGESAFCFEPLISCEEDVLVVREQEFIDAHFEYGLPLYNMRPSSETFRGFRQTHSAQSRANMSAGHKGRKASAETIAKMKLAHIGNRHGLGYRHTLGAKLKIAAAAKGNKWNVGKKHPPETIAKMRMAQSARRLREATC